MLVDWYSNACIAAARARTRASELFLLLGFISEKELTKHKNKGHALGGRPTGRGLPSSLPPSLDGNAGAK